MKKTDCYFRLCAILLFSTFVFTAQAQDCNRDCLEQHLNAYLKAVVSHKPEAGHLFIGFRQTENAIVVPEGEGVWASVTALGSVQRRYYDPVKHAAAYFGTVMEGADEAIVAVRLKVERNEVTEAEWMISRLSVTQGFVYISLKIKLSAKGHLSSPTKTLPDAPL